MAIVWKWNLNWNANASIWNNLTTSNVTWVDWKVWGAWNFNWTNSFLWNTNIWDYWNIFSISMWIKTTDTTQKFIYDSNNNTDSSNRSFIAINRNSTWVQQAWYLCFFWDRAWGIWNVASSTNININDWKWKHIVWTKDWSNNNIMYVNWLQIATSWSIPSWDIVSSFLTIWSAYWWGSLNFNWLIDEVEVDNTALTQAQIKNKYLFYNWFI